MDERFIAYLYCFNVTQDYYECHEHLESLWLDSGRPAVQQGLIQAAVCLYHLYNGNIRGAHRMWGRGRPRLVAAGEIWQGIQVSHLVADLDNVFAQVPTEWLHETVAPKQVLALQLPTVSIQYADSVLAHQVKQFASAK